jgi:hypothetical protein
MIRYYLKDRSLTSMDITRFKGALGAFGATLHANEWPDGNGTRLIAPAHAEMIEVTVAEKMAANVEHVLRYFGFDFTTTPPQPTPPARVEMYPT